MAMAIPIMMVAAAAMSFVQKQKAAGFAEDQADLARKNAELNAAYTEMEGREEERRFRYQSEKQEGLARARIAASGVTGEGTPGLYLDEMQEVADSEINWLRKSTKARSQQAQRQGEYAQREGYFEASSLRSEAWTGLMKTGAKAMTGGAGGWWGS